MNGDSVNRFSSKNLYYICICIQKTFMQIDSEQVNHKVILKLIFIDFTNIHKYKQKLTICLLKMNVREK